MIKEETQFKNYGYTPYIEFYNEVQEEAEKFGINQLPLGMSAQRISKYWNIWIEYNGRIYLEDLTKFIKCNKNTIKFYNIDFNEENIKKLYLQKDNACFSVYTEEALRSLLHYLSAFDVSFKVYNKNSNIKDLKKCRTKSTVKSAKLLREPCYIISGDNKQVYCKAGTYLVQGLDNSLYNYTKEEFNELFELY